MSTTPDQIAGSIVKLLNSSCPGLSCELGTPERKIIDAVSQAISAAYISNYLTGSLLDVETKTGLELDQFVGLWGFGRLQGKPSSGVVTIELTTPLNQDYTIPVGMQFYTNNANSATGTALYFAATQQVVFTKQSYHVDVPVSCTTIGTAGNVPPDTITLMGTALGSSSCTNLQSMVGGVDVETDSELRTRFENTMMRNIAGTSDWYSALCLQNSSVSRSAIYGPVSLYRTQISAPAPGSTANIPVVRSSRTGAGTDVAYVWPQMESVFSNLGQSDEVFYSNGSDYSMTSGLVSPPTITVLTGSSIQTSEFIDIEFQYTSTASRNNPTQGITNKVDIYVDGSTPFTVSETTMVGSSIITGDSVSTGHYYIASSTGHQDPNSPFYAGNFERLGGSGYPHPGNVFTRLNSCPIITFPETISVGSVVYQKNVDFWLLKDTTKTRGSAYELSGIEWNSTSVPSSSYELVVSYVYNQTPEVLTAVMNSSKQICTDVMVHQADYVYITPCITVQYSKGYDVGTVNNAISTRLQTYFQGQDFGSWIDIGNMCLAIQQVLGVYNVVLTSQGTGGPGAAQDTTNYGVQVFSASGPASYNWAASTAYTSGQVVTNGGSLYICTTSGTSASSGGPTGTGSGITDGTAVWSLYTSSTAPSYGSYNQETGSFKLADNQVAQFLSVTIQRMATP